MLLFNKGVIDMYGYIYKTTNLLNGKYMQDKESQKNLLRVTTEVEH